MKISIPPQLRTITKGFDEIECITSLVGPISVRQVLESFEDIYPDLKSRLLDPVSGNLRRFVNIYKGDEDIRNLQELETLVVNSDSLTILPAIAGG